MIVRRVSLVLSAALVAGCWSGEVTDQDRHALLTVHDLGGIGVTVPGPIVGEKFKRTNMFDGSYTLEYQYRATTPAMYLGVTVDVDKGADTSGAGLTMTAKRAAMVATLRSGGISVRRDSTTTQFGDEFYLASLIRLRDTARVGSLVMIRRGAAAYTGVVVGVYPSEKEWIALIAPKFSYLDSLAKAVPK